jgi:hypothetical protein
MNTKSARNASEFVYILSRDKNGKARTAIVPGHEGKRYHVILRRAAGCISGECHVYTEHGIGDACKGNTHGLCYHVLAAMIYSSEQCGSLAVCASESDAKRRAHLGGDAVRLQSCQSNKIAWGVFRAKDGANE